MLQHVRLWDNLCGLKLPEYVTYSVLWLSVVKSYFFSCESLGNVNLPDHCAFFIQRFLRREGEARSFIMWLFIDE